MSALQRLQAFTATRSEEKGLNSAAYTALDTNLNESLQLPKPHNKRLRTLSPSSAFRKDHDFSTPPPSLETEKQSGLTERLSGTDPMRESPEDSPAGFLEDFVEEESWRPLREYPTQEP